MYDLKNSGCILNKTKITKLKKKLFIKKYYFQTFGSHQSLEVNTMFEVNTNIIVFIVYKK